MNTRDHRALLWGVVVISLAWLTLRGAPSAAGMLRAAEEDAGQRAQLLERAQSRLAHLPILSDSIDRLSEFAEELPLRLLAGPDSATAVTDLMRRIRGALAAAPVRIQEFESMRSPGRPSALSEVSIMVALESDFRGMMEVLDTLEADPGLQVLAVNVAAPHADEPQPAVEVLAFQVRVRGWYRPEPAQTSGGAGARR